MRAISTLLTKLTAVMAGVVIAHAALPSCAMGQSPLAGDASVRAVPEAISATARVSSR
jgi:hypothetical protein